MEAWAVELQRGRHDAAWDEFLSQYRRVIFSAIRYYARDYDDVMDVFARVSEALREDGLRRLRSYLELPDRRARVSTWLVVVVRNITVDWFRQRDGRHRLSALAEKLPPLQRQIFELVFVQQRSHVEAYEQIRTQDASDLPFGRFLTELRATYRSVTESGKGVLPRELFVAPPDAEPETEGVETLETSQALQRLLTTLPAEDQIAVNLYVVEGVVAPEVARLLGWSTKSVYNRVYRALALLREHLQAAGLSREDL